ncbi:hypothetical protein LguiA_035128 [Lonicera macranthoides]
MCPHNPIQPSEQPPSDENRRKLQPSNFSVTSTGHRQLIKNEILIILLNLVEGRVDAKALEEELDHVAHATPSLTQYNQRVLGHHVPDMTLGDRGFDFVIGR